MKTIIAIAISLASLSVSAADDRWTITTDQGVVVRVMPSTVRIYKNDKGAPQVDAIAEATDKNVVTRSRFGVTGCWSEYGLAAFLGADGAPRVGGRIFEWALEGDRVYDMLAMMVCKAARESIVKKKKDTST